MPRRFLITALCWTSILTAWFQFAMADDLRVFTVVRDLTGAPTKNDGASVVARSLTLFHAGKVYDFVESAQEVTIYEPAHKKFTVLSLNRETATEISQDEIRRYLALAQEQTRNCIEDLKKQTTPVSEPAARALEFQLQPQFKTQFHKAEQTLSLTSPKFSYEVSTTTPPTADVADTYLKYCDWTGQLNSVLHPHSLLPGPRLALNAELKERGLLPLSVELTVTADPPLHLRADHEMAWKLSPSDRQQIHHWESALKKKSCKTVPFLEYQKAQLTAATSRKK